MLRAALWVRTAPAEAARASGGQALTVREAALVFEVRGSNARVRVKEGSARVRG